MSRSGLFLLVTLIGVCVPAASAGAQDLAAPPWWSEGAAYIQARGGQCSDRSSGAVEPSGAIVVGTARDCAVTVGGAFSTCTGSRAGSSANFACIIRGPGFIACTRGGFAQGADQAWLRAADSLNLATLAECAVAPPAIADLLFAPNGTTRLRIAAGRIAVPLRIFRRSTCDIQLFIRNVTRTGKKEVRRYRARATLAPGRGAVRVAVPRDGQAGLSRATGTIRVEAAGTCLVVPPPGAKFVSANAVLIRPPAPAPAR